MSLLRLFVPVILFLMLIPLGLSAHAVIATSYLAGVTQGQYATYEPVKAVFQSSIPGYPEPRDVKDFNNTATATVTVETVSSPARNVTLQGIETFNNGTSPRTSSLNIDLKTGAGNATYFLIAGGLTANDNIYADPNSPSINATLSMTYLGTARKVNIYNFTYTSAAYGSTSLAKVKTIWDQASGILLEFTTYIQTSSPYGYNLYENLDLVITGTNVYTPTPDFQMTASPLTTSFTAGSTGSSSITVEAVNGFSGTVILTTSVNATAGLTATCVALSPIYPGYPSSSDCTFNSSTTGAYNVTITGTSGTLTHSASVIITVTAQPDFSITTDKASVTVLAGATGTVAVTVSAQNGFTGTVTLSDSISPRSGLTCALSSDSVTLTSTTTTGTINLTCSGVYWGYTVTITGTSGAISNNAPSVSVTVQDFTVGQSSSTITTNAGTTGTATITISPHDGFSGTVALTETVDTSGLTCSLSPATLTTGSSTLSCSGSPGTYTVTVTSTSQGLSHTMKYTVTVNSVQQTPSAPASSILGLAPLIFYAIIGAIIVVVAAVSVLVLRSRKKPTA